MKDDGLIGNLINDIDLSEKDEVKEILNEFDFRKKLYMKLHYSLLPIHKKLLKRLFQIEVKEREEDTYEDYELFYWCIFLISRLGDVNDIYEILDAKYMDFDASFGVDPQYLIGAGLENTIEYLSSKDDDTSKEILKYILDCKNEGFFNYFELWYKETFEHFDNLYKEENG